MPTASPKRPTILQALSSVAAIYGAASAPTSLHETVEIVVDFHGNRAKAELKARLQRVGNSGYSAISCSMTFPGYGQMTAAEARVATIVMGKAADMLAAAEAFLAPLRWPSDVVEAEARAEDSDSGRS